MTRRRSDTFLRFALLLVALGGLVACSSDEEEPGRMVVTFYADMAIPKDVDALQLEILSNGSLRPPTEVFAIGPGAQLLPATLTLVGNKNPSTTASITLRSYSAGRMQTLRTVSTQVPAKRLSLLRIPIQWLCKDKVKSTGTELVNDCPEGKSCINGECIDDTDNTLPEYGTGDVFGGGDGEDPSTGTCFDTVTCLDQGFDVAVDVSDCTLAIPESDPNTLNIGLVTELGDAGICGRKDCYVPLDKDPTFGWSFDSGKIKLPTAACDRLKDGSVTAVRLATGPCQTKVVKIPTCGPWSSVGSYNPQESKECTSLCTEVAKAGCFDDSLEKCFARCYPGAGICDAVIDNYTACGKAFPFKSCQSTSETRTSADAACAPQAEKFQVCRKCARAANDDCDYCTCTACEAELIACDANAACANILACAERVHCRGADCNTSCAAEIAASTNGAQLFAAIGSCQTTACTECTP